MDDEILLRLLLAALWGGVLGVEREYHNKSAGFRTMIMISLGACLFTYMSMSIGAAGNTAQIAATVVTGIGFIGAGVIFRGENKVNGITTAATIWAVAAVGMAIGAGYYFAAGYAGVLILIVLVLLPSIEKLIDRLNQTKVYTVHCDYDTGRRQHFEATMQQHRITGKLIKEIKDEHQLLLSWQAQGKASSHAHFIAVMMENPLVKKFEH